MFTKTSLFAAVLLLAAAPAFAEGTSGSAATPSAMPTQTVRPATPAGTAATTPAKPATERQVQAPAHAQEGKVACHVAQPNAPVKAN